MFLEQQISISESNDAEKSALSSKEYIYFKI